METKKQRSMSAKGFLHKANGRVSAEAFLRQHREWLTTGDLAMMTSPILAKLDSKESLPSATLADIKSVVLAHHLNEEVLKGEAAMTKAGEGGVSSKPYTSTIRDKDGLIAVRMNAKGEEEDLVKSFDLPQDAERWTDRRLFDGAPDCFGEIVMTRAVRMDGTPITTVVLRGDAIARVLKKPKGAVVKKQSKSGGTLSWQGKAKQDHCSFSRG